ncbi:MAG: flagellar basal body P-ring formation protein FlgA [Gammaproteobacteria bacterium]|nr:flagellar basal body P-ring formation protein FlgA [Gammaproteobacteria bacterium]
MKLRVMGTILLLVTAMAGEAANTFQSEASIRAVAQRFAETHAATLAGETVVEVGRLDSRLRVPECDEPLAARMSATGRASGNTTVSVACNGSRRWSLLVPVSIQQSVDIVVLTRPAAPGVPLSPDMLAVARRSVAGLTSGYFTDVAQVTGWIPRRALSPDTVLSTGQLQPPKLVKRGETVTINAVGAAIAVSANGLALRDGRAGERIPVKNLSSSRVIEAMVTGRSMVQISTAGTMMR